MYLDGLIYKLKQSSIKDKLLCLLMSFLKNCQQRVVLNGQFSSWTKVNTGVPQGSVFLIFFVFNWHKRLVKPFQFNPKIFAYNTSLFFIVQDITTGTVSLNNDLTNFSEWAVKWKINFNPDPCKQAQDLVFIRKISFKPNPSLSFNGNPVHQVQLQRHLALLCC